MICNLNLRIIIYHSFEIKITIPICGYQLMNQQLIPTNWNVYLLVSPRIIIDVSINVDVRALLQNLEAISIAPTPNLDQFTFWAHFQDIHAVIDSFSIVVKPATKVHCFIKKKRGLILEQSSFSGTKTFFVFS